MPIVLPTEKIKPKFTNPRTLLIYAKPKQGKTTILSGLEGLLHIDTEQGADFVEGYIVQVSNFQELREVAAAIYEKGYDETTKEYKPPYQYLAIDTLTRIDEWSEIEGTFKYMDKPQGKSFNRVNGIKGGTKIMDPKHPEFETVHEIGQGFGYKYSREVVLATFEAINSLAPHVIYICHTKDKFAGVTSTGSEILTKEINLTGRLKDIIASKVDTIAHGYREKDKFVLNFADDTGSRASHLSGKSIVVSEKDAQGKIIFHWDQIFLK